MRRLPALEPVSYGFRCRRLAAAHPAALSYMRSRPSEAPHNRRTSPYALRRMRSKPCMPVLVGTRSPEESRGSPSSAGRAEQSQLQLLNHLNGPALRSWSWYNKRICR